MAALGTAMGVLSVSIVRGQITPGSASAQNPAHGVDKPPVVLGWLASLLLSAGQMGTQPLPNDIAHIVATVRCHILSTFTLSLFPVI